MQFTSKTMKYELLHSSVSLLEAKLWIWPARAWPGGPRMGPKVHFERPKNAIWVFTDLINAICFQNHEICAITQLCEFTRSRVMNLTGRRVTGRSPNGSLGPFWEAQHAIWVFNDLLNALCFQNQEKWAITQLCGPSRSWDPYLASWVGPWAFEVPWWVKIDQN